MGQSLYFGTEGPGEEVDELEGHEQHAAGPDTLPEVMTEAADSGKANDGEAGKSDYLDLDVQQVRAPFWLLPTVCSLQAMMRDLNATYLDSHIS